MIPHERSRRRRKLYKRSQTLATLPTHLIPEVDNEHEDEDSATEQSRLIKSPGSPTHSLESSSEVDKSDEEFRPVSLKLPQQSMSRASKKSPSHSCSKHTRTTTSSDLPPLPVIKTRGPHKPGSRHPTKKLLRTPSTPAILLNKVKDRIREKVIQTSTEWPTAAAIMHEKRQRAVESFEAQLSRGGRHSAGDVAGLEVIQLRDMGCGISGKKERTRARTAEAAPAPSSPIPETFRPDMARLAFRRRSISEDTGMQNIGRLSPRGSMASSDLRPISKSGIICSNDDLKAILTDHKRRLSPNPKHRSPHLSPDGRPRERLSLPDTESLLRNKLQTQGSLDSSSSSHSSASPSRLEETDCGASYVKAGSFISSMPTASSEYPTVVLDSRSKVTIFQPIMVTTDDGSDPCKGGPVPDVEYDEHGQTWDVYGAEFDPESLGQAIQKHLEKMIDRKSQETTILAQQLEQRKLEDDKDRKSGDGTLGVILRMLCYFARRREEPPMSS